MDKNNIDIKKLFKIIETNKKNILKITFLFFIISIFYSSIKTEYYKSTISLYAAGELDDSSLFGNYGNLANTFGLSSVPSSNYYIPDIINSRNLKKEIVLKKWNNYKFSKPTNLIDYFEIKDQSFLSESLRKIKKIFIRKKFENIEVSYLNEGIKQLSELIHVDEQNSGLIKVSVLMEEPELAADIANFISLYVIGFIKNQQNNFALKTKDFISSRLDISKDELHDSEEKLTDFRKINPLVLDTPDLQLQRARLIRAVEVNQQVQVTLREQFEISKIESTKERLFINILDEAEANPEKDKPNRLLIVIIFTICGFLMTSLFMIIKDNIKKIKEEYSL